MSSEPNIIEIYVNPRTKEILHYIPAAGMLDNGEDLPKDSIFAIQINLDTLVFKLDGSDPDSIDYDSVQESVEKAIEVSNYVPSDTEDNGYPD